MVSKRHKTEPFMVDAAYIDLDPQRIPVIRVNNEISYAIVVNALLVLEVVIPCLNTKVSARAALYNVLKYVPDL